MYDNCSTKDVQVITLGLTGNCNLNCKYCYVDKQNYGDMNIVTAKKCIDFALENKDLLASKEVVYEFLGGEPFLKIDIIPEICEYIMRRQLELNHPWKNNFKFAFTTNGTLFNDKRVIDFLEFESNKKIVTISLDGDLESHEKNRSGSFNKIIESIDWWKKTFPNGAIKATFNKETLPNLSNAVEFIIKEINPSELLINPIFEENWDQNDGNIYVEQLEKISDLLINNIINCKISLFDYNLLKLTNVDDVVDPWCGCGNSMLAFSPNGSIYPCFRFSTDNNENVGNVYINNNLDWNKLLKYAFYHNTINIECKECTLRGTCPRCVAFDFKENNNLTNKNTNICIMHKARVIANIKHYNKLIED